MRVNHYGYRREKENSNNLQSHPIENESRNQSQEKNPVNEDIKADFNADTESYNSNQQSYQQPLLNNNPLSYVDPHNKVNQQNWAYYPQNEYYHVPENMTNNIPSFQQPIQYLPSTQYLYYNQNNMYNNNLNTAYYPDAIQSTVIAPPQLSSNAKNQSFNNVSDIPNMSNQFINPIFNELPTNSNFMYQVPQSNLQFTDNMYNPVNSDNYSQYNVRKFTEINYNNSNQQQPSQTIEPQALPGNPSSLDPSNTYTGGNFHLRVSTTDIKTFTVFADKTSKILSKQFSNNEYQLQDAMKYLHDANYQNEILKDKAISNNLLFFKPSNYTRQNAGQVNGLTSPDLSLTLLNNYILAILLNKQLRRYLRKNLKPKKGTNVHDGFPIAIQNGLVYQQALQNLDNVKVDFIFTFTLLVKEKKGDGGLYLYFCLNELPESLRYQPEFVIFGGVYNNLNPDSPDNEFLSHLSTYADMLQKHVMSMILNKHEYSIKVKVLYYIAENTQMDPQQVFKKLKTFDPEKNLLYDNTYCIYDRIFKNGILAPFNRLVLTFFEIDQIEKIALSLNEIGSDLNLPFHLSVLVSSNFKDFHCNDQTLQTIQAAFPLILNIFKNGMFAFDGTVSDTKLWKLFKLFELLAEFNCYISLFSCQYTDSYDIELLINGLNMLNVDLLIMTKDEIFMDVSENIKVSLYYATALFSKWEQNGCLNVVSFQKFENATNEISRVLDVHRIEDVAMLNEKTNLVNILNYLKMYNLDSLQYLGFKIFNQNEVAINQLNFKVSKKLHEFFQKNSISRIDELQIHEITRFQIRSAIVIPQRRNKSSNFVRMKFSSGWKYIHIYSIIKVTYQESKTEKHNILLEYKENRLNKKFKRNNNNRPSFSVGSYISLEPSNRDTRCIWLEDFEMVALTTLEKSNFIIDPFPTIENIFVT